MEDAESEQIFLRSSCIDYVVLGILKDEIIKVVNTALGDTVDVEEVL